MFSFSLQLFLIAPKLDGRKLWQSFCITCAIFIIILVIATVTGASTSTGAKRTGRATFYVFDELQLLCDGQMDGRRKKNWGGPEAEQPKTKISNPLGFLLVHFTFCVFHRRVRVITHFNVTSLHTTDGIIEEEIIVAPAVGKVGTGPAAIQSCKHYRESVMKP